MSSLLLCPYPRCLWLVPSDASAQTGWNQHLDLRHIVCGRGWHFDMGCTKPKEQRVLWWGVSNPSALNGHPFWPQKPRSSAHARGLRPVHQLQHRGCRRLDLLLGHQAGACPSPARAARPAVSSVFSFFSRNSTHSTLHPGWIFDSISRRAPPNNAPQAHKGRLVH